MDERLGKRNRYKTELRHIDFRIKSNYQLENIIKMKNQQKNAVAKKQTSRLSWKIDNSC